MNIPNQLTLARLVLTAIFVAVVSIDSLPERYSIGLMLFIIAAITDFLDGYIARKHSLITNFGKLMDPLADKVLMCSAFVILTRDDLIPAWIVIAMLAREFLVTGLRLLATSQGAVLAADSLGKLKTVLQIVTIIYLLMFIASKETMFAWSTFLFEWKWTSRAIAGDAIIGITAFVTIYSGMSYMVKNRALLSDVD
ncbi:MAG: CDP-diacylglycerol--glycerol-3-phosphate 3-phosphatidyltransferase [Verrucomicrobia bacterium]|nr:CDP-diacylglycerol--glycerol-3-phosphate 3-phosphatidyltransferase [Verrucomicrobiota bacterium]